MISIVGDNFEELALIQDIIDSGILNANSSKNNIEVTYKLSSGNLLLVNNYNHIVGERKSKLEEAKLDTDYIEIPEATRINITVSPEEVKDIAALYDNDTLPNDIKNNEEWIITYPNGKHNPIYECPKCKASNNSIFKNFCPNCGTKLNDNKIQELEKEYKNQDAILNIIKDL